MGVPIDYDEDVERRRTHLLLLPKLEPVKMTVSDEQILKEIEVLAPTPKKTRSSPRVIKGILRGKANESTSSRSKLRRDKGVCWPESKYGSVSGPQWNTNSGQAHFPHLKKALGSEESRIRQRADKKLLRVRNL